MGNKLNDHQLAIPLRFNNLVYFETLYNCFKYANNVTASLILFVAYVLYYIIVVLNHKCN